MTITQSLTNGQTLKGDFKWEAWPVPEGPVEFFVDGNKFGETENFPPYNAGGDGFVIKSSTWPDGQHVFTVKSQGVTMDANVEVKNAVAPPPTSGPTAADVQVKIDAIDKTKNPKIVAALQALLDFAKH